MAWLIERDASGEVQRESLRAMEEPETSTDAIGKETEPRPKEPKIGFHNKKKKQLAAGHSPKSGAASRPKFHRRYKLDYRGEMPPLKHVKARDVAC